MLSTFLEKCPSTTLLSAGLRTIFEEALFKMFLCLPSLTEEEDSLQLLPSAYKAAFQLMHAVTSSNARNRERQEFLDRIMRHGILAGLSHASNYPRIAQVLFREGEIALNEMGIGAVKHLKVCIQAPLAMS
jgi:hypothetical protein